MPKKSIDRRLYEAYVKGRGVMLSAEDVSQLLIMDDAIGTRVSNQAAADAGLDEPGDSCIDINTKLTWREFGKVCGVK